MGETQLDYRDVERLHRDWPKQHQWRAASRDPSDNFQVGWPYIYKKNGEKAKIMCGVAMNDFPHRFLSPADLKVVVTVCRSIFKFDLTLWKMWKKINSQAVARCRESFSSLVFSQTLLSQTQPWGNATDTQFYKVSHYYSFLFQNPSFNNYNIQTIAIRFAMVRKITVMTKISKGLLDQVTQGNKIDHFFYLENFRSDQQQKIFSKYVSS